MEGDPDLVRLSVARLQVITSDTQKADSLRSQLEQAKHLVQTGPMGEALRKSLLRSPPDAILMDLDRAPATGRDLGLFLRVQKATRHCLLVYVDGDPDKVASIRALLPDAVYTRAESALEDLNRGLANTPAAPHIPESVFAGYAGRPLVAKLGIKPGMVVALIDAPQGFESSLEPLPDPIQIRRELDSHTDMVLWFSTRKSALSSHLAETLRSIEGGKLWIFWPKVSAGLESDLTQKIVRRLGLDAGWVDFKVCAVDETWSGLCFTARKGR